MMGAVTRTETSAPVCILDTDETDFALADGWRVRLTTIAQKVYDEDASANHSKFRDEVREEFHDNTRGKLAAEGSGRLVIELPTEAVEKSWETVYMRYVVKFPKRHLNDGWGGLEQNRVEIENWRNESSDYLMPVTAHHPDDWWLIMPRGEPRYSSDEYNREKWEGKVVDRHGGDTVDIADICSANIVELYEDETLRLCDYGVREI